MKIREMQLLSRVAETGSMTQAAGQLGLTPAAVSAAVQRIEGALGLRLFERTTRSLHPTEEGEVILEGCRETVARWQRALDQARGSAATLEGSVRLSAPTDTSHQLVAQVVAAFCGAHPELRVILHPSDTLQNVLEDALDLSIRYGDLQDSALVARKLAEAPRVLVASPAYLSRNGVPQDWEALSAHRLLTLQLGNSPERRWRLRDGGRQRTLPVDSPMCGDGLSVRRWAVAGHGVAFKSLFDVIEDLEAGRLERVLPQVDGGVGSIHAVLPSRRFTPARVRRLLSHLGTAFAARQARCTAWLAA